MAAAPPSERARTTPRDAASVHCARHRRGRATTRNHFRCCEAYAVQLSLTRGPIRVASSSSIVYEFGLLAALDACCFSNDRRILRREFGFDYVPNERHGSKPSRSKTDREFPRARSRKRPDGSRPRQRFRVRDVALEVRRGHRDERDQRRSRLNLRLSRPNGRPMFASASGYRRHGLLRGARPSIAGGMAGRIQGNLVLSRAVPPSLSHRCASLDCAPFTVRQTPPRSAPSRVLRVRSAARRRAGSPPESREIRRGAAQGD